MKFAGVGLMGTIPQGWTMREWKICHHFALEKNAGTKKRAI